MLQSIELTRLFSWAVLPLAEEIDLLFEAPELADALAWARQLPAAGQNEVLAAISARLPALDAAKASGLLVLGGTLVELGAEPDVLLTSGLEHMLRLYFLHQAAPKVPEAVWRFTVIGLMAMLCRSAGARALLQAQTELLAWLDANEELCEDFSYLGWVAKISDEDSVWVVFPAYETGLEISVSQVYNTFHLLTLVQPLVLQHARDLKIRFYPAPTPARLLRFAQGELPKPPADSDYARFQWLNARAYQGGPLNPAQMAWGEFPVWGLPRVRGRVVLLATETSGFSRSWGTGFLASRHDAIRPQVRVRRMLPAAEVRSLLAEIHAPVPVPEPAPLAKQGFWQRLLGK